MIHGGGDGDAPEVPTPEVRPPGLVVGGEPVQSPRELQPGGAAPRPAPLAGHRTHVYARHGLQATPAPPTRAEAERSALVALMALLGECAAAAGDPYLAPAALPARIAELAVAVSVERWIANAVMDQFAGFNADAAADGAAGRPSPVRAGHVPTWLLRRVGRPHFPAQA